MNSKTTIEEFLKHIESKLMFSEIQHKDHALLLSFAVIAVLTLVIVIKDLSRRSLKTKAKNFGLYLLDKTFRITEKMKKELPKMKLEITGHSAARDNADQFAATRAQLVYNWLVANRVAPERLQHKGLGQSMLFLYNEQARTDKARDRIMVRVL